MAGDIRMEVLKMRWRDPSNAMLDLGAGILGSFLILNMDASAYDAQTLAYNAGAVLAARMITEALEIYMIGRLQPIVELAVASAVWYGLHYAFNPNYSKEMLQKMYPGTVIALLALSRAMGSCM